MPVEYLRPDHDAGDPDYTDPPPRSPDSHWAPLAHIATFGIFVILFGAVLYLARTILLPVFAAGVVALTLAPVVPASSRSRWRLW